MITVSELSKRLIEEKSVAIFCHVRPDGDTVGSAFALKNLLEAKGATAKVYCDDTLPFKFTFLVDGNSLCNGELDKNVSAMIAVDCAEISRLGKYAQDFLDCKNTYNIDHHVSNTRYAKYNYVCGVPANAINIYDIGVAMGVALNYETVNLLAMGIITDTGSFTHQNVDSRAFLVASKLVELGADQNKIYYNTFKKQTKNRAKLFARVMAKLRFFHSDRLVVGTVTQSDLVETGAHPSETEGFVDFMLGIDTVEVCACVMEMGENKYKISLRSKGADVNVVASEFGGGGHILASGCQINAEYEEVVDRLSFAVSKQLID